MLQRTNQMTRLSEASGTTGHVGDHTAERLRAPLRSVIFDATGHQYNLIQLSQDFRNL